MSLVTWRRFLWFWEERGQGVSDKSWEADGTWLKQWRPGWLFWVQRVWAFVLFKWILGTMTCFEKWTPKLLPNLTLYHSKNTCFAASATGRRETFHLSADRIRSYHKKLTWATSARWWNRKPQAPILTWRHRISNIWTKLPCDPTGNQLRSHSTLGKHKGKKRCI